MSACVQLLSIFNNIESPLTQEILSLTGCHIAVLLTVFRVFRSGSILRESKKVRPQYCVCPRWHGTESKDCFLPCPLVYRGGNPQHCVSGLDSVWVWYYLRV